MYLLDTDTMTHLHAGHPRVTARLNDRVGSEIGTTIITKIELLRGRMDRVLKSNDGSDLLRAQRLLARTEELLEQIIVVPMDEAAIAQFDRLRKKRKIGRADLLIASIALAHRATLVTRNVLHFKEVPGLKVENWVD